MENLMLKAMTARDNAVNNFRSKFKLKKNGSQTLDFLIIALIVIIVGAALLTTMKAAMPNLFDSIITQIQGFFTIS